MPDTVALVRRLRAAGVPAVVSGAGPSVLAFVAVAGHVAGLPSADAVVAEAPAGWTALPLAIDGRGCRQV
jgi:homoserine kinase